MSVFRRALIASNIRNLECYCGVQKRFSNTLFDGTLEKHRRSELSHDREKTESFPPFEAPKDYKKKYPDFLPNADWKKRDRITEKLERKDMLRRRAVLNIPEFYPGSILAITVSDPYAPGKYNRFVGICIAKNGNGLRTSFTLRNVVDNIGVEILYELYNPTIQKVEVLKLEKRLDEELYYLRDCDPKYSTFNFNMEPVQHPPGAPIPVNDIVLKIGPRPWNQKWHRQNLKGVEGLDEHLREVEKKLAEKTAEPWEKYDIMKTYRNSIHEEESERILSEVYEKNLHNQKLKENRKPLKMD
ncbi:DgyrCDS471 [Dimorphilus gyrociliatus]|uniref:Large ribosomal subunit protein bL19m n=1 Tax=Dimorphilus gyrociliatus TaxID=2664684 RepID=A0A7I8V689_9ANNE|nr:DgyrCDS471 [Dimorphilus gyrociliatus]